jgi:hypothetical protein
MGVYDGFADSPNQIIKEGREITINFERGANNTGIVTWNVPAPAAGCGSDAPGTYDGIVITVSSGPANYLSTSPKDSFYYSYDPTVDPNLHSADKLDTAMVIGAFYHDRTTTRLVINDVQQRTPYYISGYAVDKVGRYHREGVHAYSLPTGEQEIGTPDIKAYHDVVIDVVGGIRPSLKTGLPHRNFNEKLNINDVEYSITVNGSEAITYAELVKTINKKIALLENPILSAPYPFAGDLYLDKANKKLHRWTGLTHEEVPLTVSITDPSIPAIGTYWTDKDDGILYLYDSSGWVVVDTINFSAQPDQLACGQVWFDGVDAWQWDGNHWCKLCVYNQIRNPLLPPLLTCNTYWFDSDGQLFYRWNVNVKKWDEKLIILSDKDPNTLNTGDFWFNETESKVYEYVGAAWGLLTSIKYAERNSEGELDNPGVNVFWFIPSESLLFRRDNEDLEWIEQPFTSYPTDPLDRKSCDMWWNTTSTNDIYAWDELNSQWVNVEEFFNQPIDPMIAPTLPACAVWYNPSNNTIKIVKDSRCDDIKYISHSHDPDNLPLGSVWFDGVLYFVYDGRDWVRINPIQSNEDPFQVDVGEYWYNPNTQILYIWDGLVWSVVTPKYVPVTPLVNTLWYNLIDEKLYTWTGTRWAEKLSLGYVELIPATKKDGRSILKFLTRDAGCQYGIFVVQENDDLLSNLTQNVIYYEPVEGGSGLVAGPTYSQLGIGDDGSPDERRDLHNIIRSFLGAGSVKVELKKDDIDQCINNALRELRKYSGAAYKRGFFFLDLKRNQQTYILTNKCVGFNKIVDVLNTHRMRAGWLRTSNMGQDVFAYAALQQLYSLGTFDILTFHLVSAYIEELETLFASKILFNWDERTRELKLYQMVAQNERILIDATLERTEQELLVDRETGLWIQRWAVAEAKQILSQIRGKFQTLPGPSGSTTLNSQELITQAESEKQELRAMLLDNSMQNIDDYGAAVHLVIG